MGGMLTVGYGTKAKDINDVIDKEEGIKRLRQYLNEVTYKKIKRYNLKLNENQLIAVSSFDFNTNKLIKLVKNNKIDCEKILLYNKVNVKQSDGTYKLQYSEGLDKRRKKEYSLCIKSM